MLAGNKLNDEVMTEIEKLTRLRSVDLRDNPITCSTIQSFISSHPEILVFSNCFLHTTTELNWHRYVNPEFDIMTTQAPSSIETTVETTLTYDLTTTITPITTSSPSNLTLLERIHVQLIIGLAISSSIMFIALFILAGHLMKQACTTKKTLTKLAKLKHSDEEEETSSSVEVFDMQNRTVRIENIGRLYERHGRRSFEGKSKTIWFSL